MNPFISRIFAKESRWEFLYLLVPFLLWVFCFHYFFTGQLYIQADGVSYQDHITFYTDNLSKGVFPLWNPSWYGGAPYDFFLRRIGEVNPFLFLIVLLKWFGVASSTAYLLYLGFYYFLAGWAFYLITRFLLGDRFYAFTAYVIFLFSSWGCEVFYNYIIIIFVPIIWFFYFLLCFSRNAQRKYFLGMFFCVGLIVTTYIPFFFVTILAIFTFLYLLFYNQSLMTFLKNGFDFCFKNKIFTLFCITFLLISCIPGLIFYKESKSGEFVLPNRHSGSDVSSAVAVGVENVASGDIISHGYFDRIFEDQAQIDMGDIYIPYVFFLILLTTFISRVNKLIFFLLFNILALSLITITSAAGVHRFLYDHIIIFKFIRNIYYFFWLAMLPMAILLAVSAFKSLLTAIDSSSKKTAWFGFIMICHLIFALFLCTQQGVLWGAWVGIFISLLFFLVYFFCENRVFYPLGFFLILLAVFIQSLQVYTYLDKKIFKYQHEELVYGQNHKDRKLSKLDLYYTTRWFDVLVNYMDPVVLDNYRNHRFIFYNNVVPYIDSPSFFKTFESYAASNTDMSFVSKLESDPNDWKSNSGAIGLADVDPVASGKLTVLRSDANTWLLKAHLSSSQFLVINDNYNSDWHAFINGHQVRLFRANVSFKGLWVPSGDSSILLRFSNPRRYLFHFGMILIFAGTFLYLLVLFRGNKRAEAHV